MDNKYSVATIGFFDGVHMGHRFLIDSVRKAAREMQLASAVITFDQHPRRVLHADYQPQMLTTTRQKVALLGDSGIDRCHVLHFDEQMASMSARQFMQQLLHDRLHVRRLIIGYDNRFGHNRSEGFEQYVAYGREMGIEVVQAESYALHGINVSSSVIRSFLSDGEVEMAAQCLGRQHAISGTVVDGVKEGRQMGFPTANIDPESVETMTPAQGVYAVRVTMPDGSHRMGMMNIGTRPTFDGKQTTLEVNILDYSGNLYGRQLTVAFIKKIRDERRFSSEKELIRQLEKDRSEVESIALLGSH